MDETPSRALSKRFRRMHLKSNSGRVEDVKKSVTEDPFNSSIDSEGQSPFFMIQRQDRNGPVDYSPLANTSQNGSVSEFFPRSKTVPFLARGSSVEENFEEDVFEDQEEKTDIENVSDVNSHDRRLMALVQCEINEKSDTISRRRKRPLSTLPSFDISEKQNTSKHKKLNGTTPAKINTENDVITKLEKTDSKLLGDFSTEHALEVVTGPRAKFKYISVHSLASLLHIGQSNISEVVILDARYEYEFNGGHIRDAINISSQGSHGKKIAQSKMEPLFENKSEFDPNARRILIFHCEFSSERGPRMYTLFRSMDRQKNSYPKLLWPEIYLLKGGFKEFWIEYQNDPSLFGVHGYLAMLDNEKELNEVRKMRRKAKTAPASYRSVPPR